MTAPWTKVWNKMVFSRLFSLIAICGSVEEFEQQNASHVACRSHHVPPVTRRDPALRPGLNKPITWLLHRFTSPWPRYPFSQNMVEKFYAQSATTSEDAGWLLLFPILILDGRLRSARWDWTFLISMRCWSAGQHSSVSCRQCQARSPAHHATGGQRIMTQGFPANGDAINGCRALIWVWAFLPAASSKSESCCQLPTSDWGKQSVVAGVQTWTASKGSLAQLKL